MVAQLRRQPITGLGVMCRSCCSAGLHSGAVLASAIVILGGVGESAVYFLIKVSLISPPSFRPQTLDCAYGNSIFHCLALPGVLEGTGRPTGSTRAYRVIYRERRGLPGDLPGVGARAFTGRYRELPGIYRAFTGSYWVYRVYRELPIYRDSR